ncbi:MAG: penicillin acylase family protein [Acidobacteriota bacterium]
MLDRRRQRKLTLLYVLVSIAASTCFGADTDASRQEKQARAVTIVRDDWGIAHIYGKTDADTVFGMIYAQAEDDFNRIENNYLLALGRMAEADGKSKVILDLRQKLFVDPAELKKLYAASPAWLRKLMAAWADGLNFYLAKHPQVKPRVIVHFDPWMALSFTEGSIGGDIERINLSRLDAFYGKNRTGQLPNREDNRPQEPGGSNGIAIAPSNTRNHHALLLINPHTSFYFRSELQMVSEKGLHAYGAVTWGQFFIYQGFNTHLGWMHTSSGVDAVDEYLETIQQKDGRYFYKYGSEMRPVTAQEITVPYKTSSGISEKRFTVYRTRHGPVVREENGKWVSFRIMREPIKALEESYLRTKARDFRSYKQTMNLFANSSNNTVFADADGDIAYFHGNFIPRRDTRFDFTKPVDGSNPATDWKGLLKVDEAPNLLNPASGWLYNSNNWPWSAAGASSLKREAYPAYVESGRFESARGLHAVRVLQNQRDFTVESLLAAAYDSYLPWFEKTIPALLRAWDDEPAGTSSRANLAEQIALLRVWDYRWGVSSVPTSLSVSWGEELQRRFGREAQADGIATEEYVSSRAQPRQLLEALSVASDRLKSDFGSWKTPWGEINRFQRLTDDIEQPFTDAGPSIPVGFTSSIWGSLASFGARPYAPTKKWYGTTGNSFVAVVEFGDRVRAIAVTAGGESGDPKSKHFNDQAERYARGNLREVYFYREQLHGHTEREYHPGD